MGEKGFKIFTWKSKVELFACYSKFFETDGIIVIFVKESEGIAEFYKLRLNLEPELLDEVDFLLVFEAPWWFLL